MKKILFVTSNLRRTGPTNILFNLIEKLDQSIYSPIILTLSEESQNYPSLSDEFIKLGITIHCLGLSRISGFIYGSKIIKKFIVDNNIDVVHIFGFRGDFLINSNSFNNIKIISTINSNIYDDYTMLYGKYKGSIMAYLHIRSLNNKIAIGCSEFVSNELFNRYRLKMNSIYNGINKNLYFKSNFDEKVNFRKELNIPIEKKTFIFVGYLIPRKDPITVIKSFIATKEFHNSTLLILGDGPLMNHCREIASKFENIIFLGNKNQTLSYLSASDYYISSALSEGLPTSVMEAMGCGLPVILSNILPHVELTRNLSNWDYLFPKGDNNTLTQLLNKIIEKPYDVLSNSCREIIENDINSQIMASNYQKIYLN